LRVNVSEAVVLAKRSSSAVPAPAATTSAVGSAPALRKMRMSSPAPDEIVSAPSPLQMVSAPAPEVTLNLPSVSPLALKSSV